MEAIDYSKIRVGCKVKFDTRDWDGFVTGIAAVVHIIRGKSLIGMNFKGISGYAIRFDEVSEVM